MNAKRIVVVKSSVLSVWLVLAAVPCWAVDPAEPGRATLDKLLKAVDVNDYDSFVAEGSDAFKAGMTKPMLQGVSGQLSPRMTNGYTCSYLGELMQQGCRELLWKLSFKDGGYVVQDLKSTNGTFLNNVRVSESALKPNDKIRAGQSVLVFMTDKPKGLATIMGEIEAEGKGLHTYLGELSKSETK